MLFTKENQLHEKNISFQYNIVVASKTYPHTRVTQPIRWNHVRPPAKQ